MITNKVIDRLTKEHGYDFESEFFTDEIKTLVAEVMEATERVVKTLPIHRVGVTLPLTDYANKKLNYIKGHSICRDFPNTQPTKEWVGAVLDLLEELGIGN